MIQNFSVDAPVILELGYVSALPGEHCLSGMVHARDGRPQLAGAKGGPQRGRAGVFAEDGDGVVNVRSVPAQNLVRALTWAQEPSRARDVAVCDAATGGP